MVTYLLTPLIEKIALKWDLVDAPDSRRIHEIAKPTLGGVTVFFGFHFVCLIIFFVPWLPFNGTITPEWWKNFFVISSILLLLGVADDIWEIRPSAKLAAQFFIACVSFLCNIRVHSLLGFKLPWFIDLAVTVFWIIALINAFNLIDGMDGLAIGLAAISSCGIAGSLLFRHLPGDALILIGFIGVCLAFLRYNYYPARLFLGDSGSMFIGYTIACLALSTASKGTAMASVGIPLLAVGVPIFDTILAIWRRSIRRFANLRNFPTNKGSLMKADLDHIHHRLLKQGISQRKVAILLYALNGSLVAVGLLSLIYRSHAIGIYLIAFVIGSFITVKHLARIELWDSGFAILRGLHKPLTKTKAFFVYPICDCVLLAGSSAISILLVYTHSNPMNWIEIKKIWFDSLPVQAGIPFIVLASAKIYNRVWSRARLTEFVLLAISILGGIALTSGFVLLVNDHVAVHGLILQSCLYAGISIPLLTGSRAFRRVVEDTMSMVGKYYSDDDHTNTINTLLYGAGIEATLFLRQNSQNQFNGEFRRIIVGFLDDESNLRKRMVHGYTVFGNLLDSEAVVEKYNVQEIIVTTTLTQTSHSRLLSIAKKRNIDITFWRTEETPLFKANNRPQSAVVSMNMP